MGIFNTFIAVLAVTVISGCIPKKNKGNDSLYQYKRFYKEGEVLRYKIDAQEFQNDALFQVDSAVSIHTVDVSSDAKEDVSWLSFSIVDDKNVTEDRSGDAKKRKQIQRFSTERYGDKAAPECRQGF